MAILIATPLAAWFGRASMEWGGTRTGTASDLERARIVRPSSTAVARDEIREVDTGVSASLSSLLQIVREAVLDHTLAVGPTADLYASGFTIPDLMERLARGGSASDRVSGLAFDGGPS